MRSKHDKKSELTERLKESVNQMIDQNNGVSPSIEDIEKYHRKQKTNVRTLMMCKSLMKTNYFLLIITTIGMFYVGIDWINILAGVGLVTFAPLIIKLLLSLFTFPSEPFYFLASYSAKQNQNHNYRYFSNLGVYTYTICVFVIMFFIGGFMTLYTTELAKDNSLFPYLLYGHSIVSVSIARMLTNETDERRVIYISKAIIIWTGIYIPVITWLSFFK